MPTITQQIEQILDKRLGRGVYAGNGRLQRIEGNIANLLTIREKIDQLDALIATISRQVEQKEGDYYKMLITDPEALELFNDINCKPARAKVNEVIDSLKQLKARFEREAIRVAFIGYERQGKSTFLQSMTGLPNEIIPAYDGTSCTGAVSIIHNSTSPLNVKIEFCTAAEFIDNLKSKLKGLFPDKTFTLRNLEDIRHLDLSGYEGDEALEVKRMIGNNIIGHLDDYKNYLGAPVLSLDDKEKIVEFVAQYREYESIPEGEDPKEFEERITSKDEKGNVTGVIYRKRFYKYLAVKSVDIYCPFLHQDCGKIEFVDTIGLGASINPEGIEREMFRVLREDCDAAINVFCPAPTGGSLNKHQKDIFKKINEQLSERNPRQWMAYAINGIPAGSKQNIQNIPDIMDELSDMGKSLPFGLYRGVNAADRKDVNDNLLLPLLELITQNLDELDESMMKTVDTISKEAYNECLSLVQNANAITATGANVSVDLLTLFDEKLFKDLLRNFGYAMNQIDDLGYAQKKNQKCKQLKSEYERVLDEIDMFIPQETEILDRFMSEAALTQQMAFQDYVEQMRNGIFKAFEDVNTVTILPLQEKVKMELIEIMYETALMKRLPVKSSGEGPTVQWLTEILENYITKETYPYMHDALRFILDYNISIEGLVEYNVTRGLYVIDRTSEEFMPWNGDFRDKFEDKASDVWQELCNRITPVSRRMKAWIDDFTLIPSHSFYSRVHKFHVKMMTDNGGKEDFRRFYRKNMGLIWGEEITSTTKAGKAFGDWTSRVKALQALITSENFKIN